MAEEFLAKLKKKFKEEDKEAVKIAELKRLKQGEKIIEEFVQEFQRAAKESRYERRPLIKKFKYSMNSIIQQKLIKLECQPDIIKQQYK